MAKASSAKPTWIKVGNFTFKRRFLVGWVEKQNSVRLTLEIGGCGDWYEIDDKEQALSDLERYQLDNNL